MLEHHKYCEDDYCDGTCTEERFSCGECGGETFIDVDDYQAMQDADEPVVCEDCGEPVCEDYVATDAEERADERRQMGFADF